MKSPQRIPVLLLLSLAASPFAMVGCHIERSSHGMYTDGQRAEQRNDLATAEADYVAAIEKRPGNIEARLALGKLYLETGRPKLARAQFEVYRTVRPTNTEVIDLLAQAMLESGDTGALATFVTERARDTGEVVDWVRAGDWLAQAGDADGALLAYRTAARLDGGQSVSIQKRIAAFHQSLGDDAAALKRYSMALYLAPDDLEVQAAIRALGQVPGPTLPPLRPTEMPWSVPTEE